MQSADNEDFLRKECGFTQRTCLDIVEVVMDDGEVISRREINVNSVNGSTCGHLETLRNTADENCGGNSLKMVQNVDAETLQNLQESSIPATNYEICGVNSKLPKNAQKRKLTVTGGSMEQLKYNQFENNLKIIKNRLKCGMNGGNGNVICAKPNFKFPENGLECQKGCDAEDGLGTVHSELPENEREIKLKSQMENAVGRNRHFKMSENCQKVDNKVKNGDFRGTNRIFRSGDSVVNLKMVENVQKSLSEFGNSVRVPNAEHSEKKCPSGEWGEPQVKEELFRGLGLVPRGVLHDNGRPVDRRHCVTGRRTVQADSELAERGYPEAERGPTETVDRPRNVFYPSGVPTMFDTEKFIGEIQKRPAIYDVRSKVYSNRVAKLKYWHEVGQEMYKGWEDLDQMERRALVKELQIKWKSIRDHFMRQLKQNINGEGPKKKKYVHFDQLQFLTANLGVKRRWQPWKRNWGGGEDPENSMSGSGCSRVQDEQDPLQDPLRVNTSDERRKVYPGPRHSYKIPKTEPEEEYMEFTPELPEERHFSFVTSVERGDYDEREVPVAALLPAQPEDLSYHREPPYYHHQDLSYHKELEGDRMGNKMFLLSLLPIMERLPDHANIRARLQLMEVLQAFVAHEDAPRRDYYANHHNSNEKRGCDVSQQHSTTSHSDSDC